MHNNVFWCNSNALSLIICKVHTKRENSGSRKFGPRKATSSYLFWTTPNKLKLYGDFLWNIWGILEPISTRGGPPGGHNPPGRAREPRRALVGCAHPGKTFGMERHRLEAELGQEHFFPPAEWFRQGNFPPGGGNHRHHQQLSHLGEGNLHQHLQQHHLISNPSSSPVFNLVTGTIDWCLWVTSSVDYIL